MEEVEIISMLMPASASVSNVRAVTPGWVFMPTPTSDTRATSSSPVTPVAPSSGTSALHTSVLTARSYLGDGEGDVGRPVERDVLDDHVDVDVPVGQAPEQPGGQTRAGRAPR